MATNLPGSISSSASEDESAHHQSLDSQKSKKQDKGDACCLLNLSRLTVEIQSEANAK